MKAIRRDRYGPPDVLELGDIDKPVANDDAVLVRVRAASLNRLIEAAKVSPVIDRRYPLADVPEALRYLQAGHARGKVVITV